MAVRAELGPAEVDQRVQRERNAVRGKDQRVLDLPQEVTELATDHPPAFRVWQVVEKNSLDRHAPGPLVPSQRMAGRDEMDARPERRDELLQPRRTVGPRLGRLLVVGVVK